MYFANGPQRAQRRCTINKKVMAQKANNLVQSIRNEAKREAEKDFAADWGYFWKVAGSWIGQYIMAIVGFAADFAVAYSMLYGATKHGAASFLGAVAICAVIQYGYGGATFRITKAVKTGKISEGRYMRSSIIGGAFGLAALGASLYLSFNFDSVFRVASEPQAAKELVDENSVNGYYDSKIATLRNDYNAQYETLQAQRKDLSAQRTESGEILWTSRRSMEKMDTRTLPALRSAYEAAVAALETERSQRLQQVIAGNVVTMEKWDAKIAEGAMFTRWFNIGVNLLRVLLIVGYAIFLLDVYQDEEEKMEQVMRTAPGASSYMAVSNPPAETVQRNGPESVANYAQSIDMRKVAYDLERQKSQYRSYKSKIKATDERNVLLRTAGKPELSNETNLAGLARAKTEIERLQAILSGRSVG